MRLQWGDWSDPISSYQGYTTRYHQWLLQIFEGQAAMLNSSQLYHCGSSSIINSCQSDVWLLYLYRILSLTSTACPAALHSTSHHRASTTTSPAQHGTASDQSVNHSHPKLPPHTYKVSRLSLWWDWWARAHPSQDIAGVQDHAWHHYPLPCEDNCLTQHSTLSALQPQ